MTGTQDQLQFPYERCGPCLTLDKKSVVGRAWQRSHKTLRLIRKRLKELDPCSIDTVVLAGSLGRMEQLDHSDADALLLGEQVDPSEAESVWEIFETSGLALPDPTGVFSTPVRTSSLTDYSHRGVIAESVETFGARIQLLLDSQPVYGNAEFDTVQRQILQWYYANGWDYLADDLHRYYRSLKVLYRWKWQDDRPLWRAQNTKLGFSRYTMIVALLWLLGLPVTQGSDGIAHLQMLLRLTPLERLHFVYQQFDDDTFQSVLDSYEAFLDWLERHYQHGQAEPPRAEPLRKLLVDFLLQHRQNWCTEFIEQTVI